MLATPGRPEPPRVKGQSHVEGLNELENSASITVFKGHGKAMQKCIAAMMKTHDWSTETACDIHVIVLTSFPKCWITSGACYALRRGLFVWANAKNRAERPGSNSLKAVGFVTLRAMACGAFVVGELEAARPGQPIRTTEPFPSTCERQFAG